MSVVFTEVDGIWLEKIGALGWDCDWDGGMAWISSLGFRETQAAKDLIHSNMILQCFSLIFVFFLTKKRNTTTVYHGCGIFWVAACFFLYDRIAP